MKRHWVEYTETWVKGPMTPWVHVASEAGMLMPPAPSPIAGKGFAIYYVEVDRFTFQFASLDEIQVCLEVLGKRLLPSSIQLAKRVSGDPAQHWLRTMPDSTKPWRYRQKAVKYLHRALADFRKSARD